MRRETGGIFLLSLGIVLILFMTTAKGRAVWAVLTGRAGTLGGGSSGGTGTTKKY